MADNPLVRLEGLAKSFGLVRALDDVSLDIPSGACVGIVGHNGAGKSTLMNILAGVVAPDRGRLLIGGQPQAVLTPARTKALGIRCVFQELSLCPNLSVAENVRVFHPAIGGIGWRGRAGRLIRAALDDIFPGNGISPADLIEDLPLGRRQMVEIARAFTVSDQPARLVILDEPTSSLDAHTAAQLLAYVRRVVATGLSCALISHILGEILRTCDRVVVMRDGRIVAADPVGAFDRARLITAMGNVEPDRAGAPAAAPGAVARTELRVRLRPARQRDDQRVEAHQGEIVGLAGLAGHGQTDLLLAAFAANGARGERVVAGPVALVAGDRQADGVFREWSIARNIGVRSLAALRGGGGVLLSPTKEDALANAWRARIGIRTADVHDNILSLSGGNQQKALFARALASDARIVLMDDPMRGVDYGTKLEVYDLIRAEARAGRTFLWYTTETAELENCDRAYVFRDGAIVAHLPRAALTEERVIAASFEGTH